MARWFGWPGILMTSPVPLLVALLAWRFWRGLERNEQFSPFGCALGVFLLCFAGLGISLFPLMVPPSLTIWDTAAPRSQPVVPAGGRVRAGADHPGLHRLCLLGVPRQGAARGRLSLRQAGQGRALRRWLWFVGLWAAGVVSVTSVGVALRWLLLGRC